MGLWPVGAPALHLKPDGKSGAHKARPYEGPGSLKSLAAGLSPVGDAALQKFD